MWYGALSCQLSCQSGGGGTLLALSARLRLSVRRCHAVSPLAEARGSRRCEHAVFVFQDTAEDIQSIDSCEYIWEAGVGFAQSPALNFVHDLNR